MWYWVFGIRYWCLLEISINFIYLRIAKYKNQKKFLYDEVTNKIDSLYQAIDFLSSDFRIIINL
jgi:hypothetical protein